MVTLIILDGFGCRKEKQGNAIQLAGTPFLNKLKKNYSHTLLKASGKAVGLSENQMGNSEVGHLTIGSGRILLQDLEKINNAIQNNEFYKNKELNKAIEFAKKNNSSIHLIGLVSDGGVHSHINHLKALIELAQIRGVKNIYIHVITDGRDTLIDSGISFIKDLQLFCAKKNVEIASLCGRFYAMDREKRYENTKMAYDMLVFGKTDLQKSNNLINNNLKETHLPKNSTNLKNDKLSRDTSENQLFSKIKEKKELGEVFKKFYKNGIYDEFIEPTIIDKPRLISENDSVIFFNFRSDRMRQLADALSNPKFSIFETKKFKNVCFVSMTEYSQNLKNISVAFPNEKIKNTLSEILSKHNKKQFHIAETTKYAHVTFFFNGGREIPFENEERCLIPTLADPDFTKNPQMRALEITEKAKEALFKKKYDFILINLSNPDMLGHTANLEATKKAITCIDKCAYDIAMACLKVGSYCIITADHGNAEMLIDNQGKPCTTHTTNPVPFILITPKTEKKENEMLVQKNLCLKTNGGLANIAATVLELLNLPKSSEMLDSLIKN